MYKFQHRIDIRIRNRREMIDVLVLLCATIYPVLGAAAQRLRLLPPPSQCCASTGRG
jgi:hypothetical protein